MRGAGGAVGGGRLEPPRRHSSDERAGTLRKLATKLRAVMLPKRNLVGCAGNHGRRRHGKLRNDDPNVRKVQAQIGDDRYAPPAAFRIVSDFGIAPVRFPSTSVLTGAAIATWSPPPIRYARRRACIPRPLVVRHEGLLSSTSYDMEVRHESHGVH